MSLKFVKSAVHRNSTPFISSSYTRFLRSYSTLKSDYQSNTNSKMSTPIDLEPTPERAAELISNYNDVNSALLSELQNHNRSKSTVLLLAVSKYKPESDVMALYNQGVRHFGENYVQELTRKAEALPKDIHWHFIGALQSNKCKILCRIPNLYSVETVDSVSKCDKLNSHRPSPSQDYPPLNVYIQINTSNEGQKSGISTLDEAYQVCKHVVEKCPNIYLDGLMTIGSFESSVGDGENKDFAKLNKFAREISEKLESELSSNSNWGIQTDDGKRALGLNMGMSHDYLEAIRQGSNTVRIGSSIFGARLTKEEIKK